MISAGYDPVPVAPPARPRRLFIAITLPADLRDALADLSSRLQKGAHFTALQASWVPSANMHLTIHFLGPVPADRIPDLQTALGGVGIQCRPFTLQFQGLGYFPHAHAPKVLWVGVPKPPSALNQLVEITKTAVQSAGLELQHDNFHPHITLARFRSLKGTAAFVNMAKNYATTAPGSCEVGSIALMESLLSKGAPEYRVLEEYAVGKT
jgi:2'-5' RNA ligase